MSSFGKTLDKTLENINSTIDEAIGSVASVVQETGNQISSIFNGNNVTRQDSSDSSAMGNVSSKKSSASTTASQQRPQSPTRKIPTFNVAYGVNSAGKSVLYRIDIASMFPQLDENKITVRDLQTYLSILTSVPVEHQQLIHRGAHLHGDTLIINLGIREGAKIMMLGRKPVDPDEEIRKQLSAIEDEISTTSMEVVEVELKVDKEPVDSESAPRALHKKLLHLNENYMKILMRLDALEIPVERTEVRARRKALVVRVHQEMEKADKAIHVFDNLSRAIVPVGDPDENSAQ